MHEQPENIRRKVIPRWRKLDVTPKEELAFSSQKNTSAHLQDEFNGLLLQWQSSASVNNAAELLYAATLGFDDPEIYHAAQFIIESRDASPGTKRLATTCLPAVDAKNEDHTATTKTSFQIRTLKKELADYPRNAIAHVELARAYVLSGQTEKANHHIRIATQLAPTSRFVLRSAGRFDVHRGDLERSLKALANVASRDPWLAAAYVSIADLGNRSLKKIKPIRALLDQAHDPAQISELAAALGTLELKSSGLKKARKYFQLSSVAPNENVVAQLYWLSKNYGVGFDEQLLSRLHAYEARAQSAASTQSWPIAIDSCWRWLDDEPFSIRPAYEGGFVASEILHDFKTTQEFAHRGLISNPKDVGLTNNLAYSLIMDENLYAGNEHLQRAKQLAGADERHQLILQATEGLLCYRRGNSDEGARLYMSAILHAHELKAQSLMHLAYLHFCFEEMRIGHAPPFLSLDQIEKVFTGPSMNKTTKAVFENMLLPMLLARQKYGLVDVGHTPSAPYFERELLSNTADSES
jgi:Flp pilus assembly protein TadD